MNRLMRPPLQARANSGLAFRPDSNTVLWLPGQDDPQSSTIRDRSGKGNNGAITGATWKQTGQGLWYLDFDGTDDIVKFGNPDSLNITGSQTFKMWVNPSPLGGGQQIYGKDNEVAERQIVVGLRQHATIGIEFVIFKAGGSASSIFGGTALTADTWNHIVCVYTFVADGSSLMDVYLHGVIDATQITNAVGPVPNETLEFAMGAKDVGAGTRDINAGIALMLHESGTWTAGQVADDRNQDRHHFGV